LVVLLLLAAPGLQKRTRHLDSFTADIAEEALLAAPKDAIVIVSHDHWVAPMLYLQEQRQLRPDVVVLAHGLASSEWYWNHLYRRHPDLAWIQLRAPGGRNARIRRFLEANRERPVQVERVALASTLGLPVCAADWMLDSRTRCVESSEEPALARAGAAALSELGEGSPGTSGLIALITLHRGHDLYSLGWPRAAIATLLSGVPFFDALSAVDLSSVPARVSRTAQPDPVYRPRVALGHPAQNLHYAAVIARMTGAVQLGDYLKGLSDALGPVTPKFAAFRASADNL
jgi:hypothetical protein